MPHPTTATLGISRKRYLAGPEAYDRQTIAESNKCETILEQIIAQTQHDLLRLRTMHMIDALASEIKDPIIVAHWLCLNSATKSSVKINIISYGYESLCRTPLVIHIGTKTLKAICRDGRVINMSYEAQELRYLLLNQVINKYRFSCQ
jgi:mediator of RNA polymerase II transcription subunit 17